MATSFEIISPVNNEVYASREYASSNKIEQVLATSQISFKEWKASGLELRAEICLKAVEYFQKNIEELSSELTWSMGRPIRYTPFEIKGGFKERAEYMVSTAMHALADVKVPDKEGFTRFIRKEPLGTVFVMAPWNYPYLTSVNAIIPAIMAGNTVILKHATQTALCAERYMEAFQYAGLPEGVFQFLHIDHERAAAVMKDDRIAYVAFTGSVEGGAAVQNAIGSRFISAGLELGGKDPAYVMADVNLNNAIENLVDGSFFNSGQSCCGIERIYVDRGIYDDFVSGFVSLTKEYILGDPTDPATTLGPMVRIRNAQTVLNQLEDARRKGAKELLIPADFPSMPLPYLPPQVLTNVTHQMDVMREETFGPVIGIMPVDSEKEAIRLMNDSKYGLTASLWTSDQDRALRIGDEVETGTFFMNRSDYLDPELAWTGIKDSGKGCTLSSLGYDYLTRPKSFHLKH